MQKLCTDDGAESNAGAGDSATSNLADVVSCVCEYTQPIRREEELLIEQQDMIKRQDALRPFFPNLMRGPLNKRERAYFLRRYLVDANVDITSITEAWNAGQKEGVSKLLEEKVRAYLPKFVQHLTAHRKENFDSKCQFCSTGSRIG